MSEPSNADIITKLAVLATNQQNLENLLKEERTGAAQHRQEVRSELSNIKMDLRTVVQDVAEMAPMVNRLEENRLMAVGAGKLAQWTGRGFVAIVGLIGAFATWAINRFLGS